MAGREIEHETDVRRPHPWPWRRLAIGLAVVVLAGVAGASWIGGGGAPIEEDGLPATPTSAPATSRPPGVPTVLAVADVGGGPVPTSAASDRITRRPPVEATFEALQATPLAVGDRVVVLVDGGRLLAGVPGEVFEPFGPATPVSELVGSDVPGHVWARVREDELELLDPDGDGLAARIAVGDERVLGPARGGVVTVSADGTLRWRRPGEPPTELPLPEGSAPVDAGGELVLVEAPDAGDGVRRFETWSLVEQRLLQTFATKESDRVAVIAGDGATVALPRPEGWDVRDAVTGDDLGRLPGTDAAPVWVGDHHFAVAPTTHYVDISDSIRHRPRWPVVALAERSS